MTELELIDALAAKLEEIFEGITIKGKDDVLRPVRVFKQYIPQGAGLTGVSGYADSDYESNFPCVIVKYLEHTDKEENRFDQSMTSIKLIYGVYDNEAECQGYRDILNMIDRTRLNLLHERTLAKRFMLAMPLKTRLLEADTFPVYFGEMDLYYITGRPVMGRDFYTKEAIPNG